MQMKQFTLQNKPEVATFSDIFELYRIDKHGRWELEIETNNNPTTFQKILCKLGIKNYAGDALMNYALSDLATYLSTKYLYCSVGTDGTDSNTYTYTDLKSPVMSRVASTNTVATTYTTNDTAVYTSVFTSDGDYTLQEAGLHTTLTSGNMGARQTYYNWDVETAENFGTIWKIINNRGV